MPDAQLLSKCSRTSPKGLTGPSLRCSCAELEVQLVRQGLKCHADADARVNAPRAHSKVTAESPEFGPCFLDVGLFRVQGIESPKTVNPEPCVVMMELFFGIQSV